MFAFFNDFFCLLYRRVASVVRCRDFDARDGPSSSLLRVHYARLCQRTDPLTVQQPSSRHKNRSRFSPVTLCSTDGHVHREFILFVFSGYHHFGQRERVRSMRYCTVWFTRTELLCGFIMSLALECDAYGNCSPASVRLLCMQNIEWTIFVYDLHGKYYSKWGGLFISRQS